MSHPTTTCADSVQVMYRCSDSILFIRENGRTHPASLSRVQALFGSFFAECVLAAPGVWIEYDGSDEARIASNRARYEPVGVPLCVDCDITGKPFYGVLDRTTGQRLPFVLVNYESALMHIDDIGRAPLSIPIEMMSLVDDRGLGTGTKIAAANMAAVDAVTALFNRPTKPAA